MMSRLEADDSQSATWRKLPRGDTAILRGTEPWPENQGHCQSDHPGAQSIVRIKEQRKQLVRRRSTLLNAESSRVITRPHIPEGSGRIAVLIDRVAALADDDVRNLLDAVIEDFAGRHRKFRETLQRNFRRVEAHVPPGLSLSTERQLLLGAYFTAEYSVEAAALFNPAIVAHPDQKGVEKGSKRIVKTNRATADGHETSIELRSCIVYVNHDIYYDPVIKYLAATQTNT